MLPSADYQLCVVNQVETEKDYHDSRYYYAEEGVAGEEREHQDQKHSHPIIILMLNFMDYKNSC
jgi:hypothetical protein